MNKKIIKPLIILLMIITVSLAFKKIIKNDVKSSNNVTNKKMMSVKDATAVIMNPKNEFNNLLIRGFYKSSTIKNDELIVTLTNTVRDSGEVYKLPCQFLYNDNNQFNDIPVNAEIVLTGNPVAVKNMPKIVDCKLISINLPDLSLH